MSDERLPLSEGRAIVLVARREILDRLRQRAFIISFLLMLGVVLAVIVIPAVVGRDTGPDRYEIGVVDDDPSAVSDTMSGSADLLDVQISTPVFPDRDAAISAVEADEIDVVLVDRRELISDGTPPDVVLSAVDASLSRLVVATRLEEAGLSPAIAAGALAPVDPVEVLDVNEGDGGGDDEDGSNVDAFVGLGAGFLLFFAVTTTSNVILTGTMEEKASRVVEVLLGTLRPRHLLAGKLVGLGLLGLAQVVIIVAVSLGTAVGLDQVEVPDLPVAVTLWGLVFFLAGFTLYAVVYAVVGAMSQSPEDAQSSAAPVVFMLVGGWVATASVVLPNPDGAVARLVSVFPPSAPIAMPARIGVADVPLVEVLGALALLALTIWLGVRLGGRLYRVAILSSSPLDWRELWRRSRT